MSEQRRRPIKFRAWDLHQQKMWGVARLDWVERHDYTEPERQVNDAVQAVGVYDQGPEGTWSVEKVYHVLQSDVAMVLMQNTGLEDVHGHAIYEGDVVEWKLDSHLYTGSLEAYRGEIIFHEGAFWVTKYYDNVEEAGWMEHETLGSRISFVGNTIEVLGNRYEHPELLSPAGRDT